MIGFKNYRGNETLKEQGFQVFNDDAISKVISTFSTDLNEVSNNSKHEEQTYRAKKKRRGQPRHRPGKNQRKAIKALEEAKNKLQH